jgi:hypothetical protein
LELRETSEKLEEDLIDYEIALVERLVEAIDEFEAKI